MTIDDKTHKYEPVAAVPVEGGDVDYGLDKAITITGQPYLEVVAPATLPEGYTFEAQSNGHAFTVTVPVGGVEEGQKFTVPFPTGATGSSGAAVPHASVHVGFWKDGLCDCCVHGCFHPVLWNACCCPGILIGQVMQRLKLTWLANKGGTPTQTASTFKRLFFITIFMLLLNWVISWLPWMAPSVFYKDANGLPSGPYFYVSIAEQVIDGAFTLFILILVCKTRMHIRKRYNIAEKYCHGCEDCCCAYWCTCCTVAQMARHTGDYDTYAARCCTKTGMSSNAPSIV